MLRMGSSLKGKEEFTVTDVVAGLRAAVAGILSLFFLAFTRAPRPAPGDWPLRRLVEVAGLTALDCPPQVRLRVRGANDEAERAELMAQMTTGIRAPTVKDL